MHQYVLGASTEESSYAKKDLGALVGIKLTMSKQCCLVTKKVNSLLGCIRKSVVSSLREVTLHLDSALVRHIWSPVSSVDLPNIRKIPIDVEN